MFKAIGEFRSAHPVIFTVGGLLLLYFIIRVLDRVVYVGWEK